MDNYYQQGYQPNDYQQGSEELGWNDTIEKDGPEYVIVPAGDYEFTVTNFERGRHTGSDKLPPCNKAILSIRLDTQDGSECVIKHNLFLSRKTEGLLCAFFTAIGQRKHGERVSMDWNRVVGSKGRCKVGVRKYTNKNGGESESNEIQRFYEPDEKTQAPTYGQGYAPQQTTMPQMPSAQPQGYVPGKF